MYHELKHHNFSIFSLVTDSLKSQVQCKYYIPSEEDNFIQGI